MTENQETFLKDGASLLHIDLANEQIDKMLQFKEMVLKKNEVMNLTAITDDVEFMKQHLFDSMTVVDMIPKDADVIDIGTGAGFPGMVIKILRPDCNIILLDSLLKRIRFLKEAIDELGLKQIDAIHARAEDMAKQENHREQFDIAISRAVAPLYILNELCIPFVKLGGDFIAMKSRIVDEELVQAAHNHRILGCDDPTKTILRLPFSDIERTLLTYHKIKKTPGKFPRSPKVIKKSLLQ